MGIELGGLGEDLKMLSPFNTFRPTYHLPKMFPRLSEGSRKDKPLDSVAFLKLCHPLLSVVVVKVRFHKCDLNVEFFRIQRFSLGGFQDQADHI
jgi:hypothetical protein